MEIIICVLLVVLALTWNSKRLSEKELHNNIKAYLDRIEEQKKQIELAVQELGDANSRITAYVRDVAELKKQIDDVKRELDFYKNIEEASGNLNVRDNNEEYLGLLEQATQQIGDTRAQKPDAVKSNNDITRNFRTLLDREQEFACEEMERSNDNFFITGKAGTGKSFLLDAFRKTTN